ncbi:MAG TPA: RyR domain-containing protein [Thermoleophilaceae bacterium]|nr:RyR domain-containing protein [Thermoleophilaceae bacterium]
MRARRVRLRPVWRQTRPFVVLGIAALVLILGTLGFQDVYDETRFDSLYRALGLFGLGGTVEHGVPPELQVARILGPLVTGYAAIRGLLAISREQVQLLWFRLFLKRHVVVAGLGAVGFRLARSLNDAGFHVVAVDRDPANPAVAGCRERGIGVLTADASDPAVLRSVRCDRADLLIVSCGDDGVGMDVATAATNLAKGRRSGVLTVFVHLDDMVLWRTLQAEEVRTTRAAPVRLEFFNVFEQGAYLLLERFPPFPPGEPIEGARTVLVLGFDGVAHSLVVHAVRRWQDADRRPDAALRILLLGPTAEQDRVRLMAWHPELGSICRLTAHPTALGVELERAALGLANAGATAVYVCLQDEAAGMAAAMALRANPQTQGASIVVTVADAGAGVSSSVRDGAGILEDVDAFGVMTASLKPDLLLRGTTELLARAKHDEYRAQQLAAEAEPGPAALVPWDELSEDLKTANRQFADGIGEKLDAVDCGLVAAPLTTGGGFSFTDAELEKLARLEHDRWVRDKERDGFRYGPERDDARRIHPLLVPWEELSDDDQEKDRSPMRELPQILARLGLEIRRSSGPDPDVGQDPIDGAGAPG